MHSIEQIDAAQEPFTDEDREILDAMALALKETGANVQLRWCNIRTRNAWDV